MSNPPLDFQQNPVEFVMDALRVARAATETATILSGKKAFPTDEARRAAVLAVSDYTHKFNDPPTVIAILEDWRRLREERDELNNEILDFGKCAAEAMLLRESLIEVQKMLPSDEELTTKERSAIEVTIMQIHNYIRAALAKQG